MNKKLNVLLTSAVLLVLPVAILAAVNIPNGQPGTFGSISGIVNGVLDLAWPVLVGFSVIMFVVAGFLFVSSQGDATKVAGARSALLWAAVGLVVGIISFSLPSIICGVFGC